MDDKERVCQLEAELADLKEQVFALREIIMDHIQRKGEFAKLKERLDEF